MDYPKLRRLREKLFFTVRDVAALLGITRGYARLLSFRCVRQGLFVRLKNDFYVLDEKWPSLGREDLFRIANYLQVPSYISFTTALSFYEITTQVPRNYFESACLKRSKHIEAKNAVFQYYKLKPGIYSGFVRIKDLFIASPEKALLDALYLYSYGKYALDISAIDASKLDKKTLKSLMRGFPAKTQEKAAKICKI